MYIYIYIYIYSYIYETKSALVRDAWALRVAHHPLSPVIMVDLRAPTRKKEIQEYMPRVLCWGLIYISHVYMHKYLDTHIKCTMIHMCVIEWTFRRG